MPLLSHKEVLNLKLGSIKLPELRQLSLNLGISKKGSSADIVKRILESQPDEQIVNEFIKMKYAETIQERKSIISDDDLKKELMKVKHYSWGVIQGQLDQKIQTEYTRKIVRYEELLNKVKAKLHDEVTDYVICTWFNHWTTLLIEDHISIHNKVIPTIKNVKGIDIFFDGQPFDLKTTYMPRDYDPFQAMKNPLELARWMYENQGAQRFGADNRFYVILFDKDRPERSWELKRDFNFVFHRIDNFLNSEEVSDEDEIIFTYGRKTYTAVTKILIITK